MMLFGGGANMWVTISPGLRSAISLGSGDTVWPIWIITGRLNDEATSCARLSTSKSFGPATSRDSRALTPAIISRFVPIASRAAADIGAAEVHRVAFGQDTGAPDVDQNAALLRRRLWRPQSFRRCDPRPAIPHRSSPSRRRRGTAPAHLDTRRVGVDIDQPGHHQLAARVDRFGGVGRMLASTATIRPSAIATSRIASSLREGSMTRPPLRSGRISPPSPRSRVEDRPMQQCR